MKFILTVAHARSGSTYLCDEFNRTDNIHCRYELLHNNPKVLGAGGQWEVWFEPFLGRHRTKEEADAFASLRFTAVLDYLDKAFFNLREYAKHHNREFFSFKVFHDHQIHLDQAGSYLDRWKMKNVVIEYLLKRADYVIILDRKPLDIIFSENKAAATKHWAPSQRNSDNVFEWKAPAPVTDKLEALWLRNAYYDYVWQYCAWNRIPYYYLEYENLDRMDTVLPFFEKGKNSVPFKPNKYDLTTFKTVNSLSDKVLERYEFNSQHKLFQETCSGGTIQKDV